MSMDKSKTPTAAPPDVLAGIAAGYTEIPVVSVNTPAVMTDTTATASRIAKREVVRCAQCRWGRDVSLDGARRCRRNPPQAHFIRMLTISPATPYAQAMWPIVQASDYCGEGDLYAP